MGRIFRNKKKLLFQSSFLWRGSGARLPARTRSARSCDVLSALLVFGLLYRTVLVPLRFCFAVVFFPLLQIGAKDCVRPLTTAAHAPHALLPGVMFLYIFFLHGFAHRDLRVVWVFCFLFLFLLFLNVLERKPHVFFNIRRDCHI